jgi:hypothetical protein
VFYAVKLTVIKFQKSQLIVSSSVDNKQRSVDNNTHIVSCSVDNKQRSVDNNTHILSCSVDNKQRSVHKNTHIQTLTSRLNVTS